MPKKARELSAQEVAKLSEEGRHAVGGAVARLHLRIEAGCKSWVLRKAVGGRRRDLGLGSYPLVSLSAARRQALRIHVNGPCTVATETTKVKVAVGAAVNVAPAAAPGESGRSFEWCSRTYIDAQAPG